MVIAVADTKYKLLDENGRFPEADAYQLIAYCSRLGLAEGHLVYAAGDPRPEPYEIVGAGLRLVIHAVRLDQPLERIETDVGSLLIRLSVPSITSASSAADEKGSTPDALRTTADV